MTRIFLILTLLSMLLTGCVGMPRATAEAVTAAPSPSPTPTPFPTATSIATPVAGTLYVNPAMDLGPISPYIFGSNYGPWAAVPFGMLSAAYDAGVTILRFPGGEWGDQNDLTPLQIDQFVEFCKKMGAIPMISVRLKNGTPESAAGLVHYANIEKAYGILYWSIGNEPDLYAPAMKQVYDSARLDREWRAIALAMKAVDPGIKLVGPEFHQYSYKEGDSNYGHADATDSSGLNWLDVFLKSNGDLVDIVSFHRYPYPVSQTSPAASIEDLRRNAADWDKYFAALRDRIHQITGRELPIAVTEFSSHYNKPTRGEATPDSNYHAIWLADVLGRMLRENVFMANYWLLASTGQGGATGLIGYGELRPSYYVYQLYKKFGNQQVYSSSDDPDLSIYTAKRPDGTLTVVVINLSLEDKTKPIRFENQSGLQAEAWLLDPTHKAEAIGSVDLSGRISVPPQSMTLYVVRP